MALGDERSFSVILISMNLVSSLSEGMVYGAVCCWGGKCATGLTWLPNQLLSLDTVTDMIQRDAGYKQ